jgi:hypothetical protein
MDVRMKTMLTFVALLGLLMVPSAFVRAEVYASAIQLTNPLDPPSSITAIGGTPQSAQVSTAFPTRFRVLVRDSFNNPVPEVMVTWTPPPRGPSGTFEGGINTAMTDSSGRATAATFTANDTAGTYTVPATVQGIGATALFILTNTGTSVVENETSNLIPDRFALQQNYPNPFNPMTAIRYQTSEVSRVTLNVFDILGRGVATLVDEVQEAGFKMVEFNAEGLASGVYFYRLRVNNAVLKKK